MKFKKAVELIIENCTDDACQNETCPFMSKAGCAFVDRAPAEWDIETIKNGLKKAKKARKK